MRQETLDILCRADDSVAWQVPDGLDWTGAMSRVKAVQTEIEQIVGPAVELDEYVQDASYFAEISLIKPRGNPRYIDPMAAVRFSAFGGLFTVWWHPAVQQFPLGMLDEIIEVVERHGFIYVNAEELKEPYTGRHEGFKQMEWWVRFFDHV